MSTLTEGKFKARARKEPWALSESSKGTPQVTANFEITTEGYQGESMPWYGYLSEGAADRTIESLRYMGWKGDNLTQLDNLDANEVELVIANEEYEGKTSLRIQWVNRLGVTAAPMAADKAKVFAAAMQARIRALDAAGGRKRSNGTPPGRAPEPPPHTDGDAPPF